MASNKHKAVWDWLARSIDVNAFAELAQRHRVRHVFRCEVQSHDLPHGMAVVDRGLGRLIRQIEPRQAHSEYHPDAPRFTAQVIFVSVSLDHRHDPIPWRDRVHRLKKIIPLRLPRRLFQIRETLPLLHRHHSLSTSSIPYLPGLISNYTVLAGIRNDLTRSGWLRWPVPGRRAGQNSAQGPRRGG